VPKEPAFRSLLDELKKSGGLSTQELSDLGVEKVAQNYPGLLRKDGGMKMDRVVEWMDQNGWFPPGVVDDLERNAVGGSHEYARDMLRSALGRESVIHPADYDAFASYGQALKNLEERGIRQVTIPGTEKVVPSDFAIPVQLAQELKKGTYKTLSKSYGELKGAEIEAQKALARGLKEKISESVPQVAGLNKRESDLLNALKVTERRALMDANKNPLGLGAIAPDPARMMAFLADRNAWIKSMGARGLYQASKAKAPAGLLNEIEQTGLLGAPSLLAISP
jgi:hypothetical protein